MQKYHQIVDQNLSKQARSRLQGASRGSSRTQRVRYSIYCILYTMYYVPMYYRLYTNILNVTTYYILHSISHFHVRTRLQELRRCPTGEFWHAEFDFDGPGSQFFSSRVENIKCITFSKILQKNMKFQNCWMFEMFGNLGMFGNLHIYI